MKYSLFFLFAIVGVIQAETPTPKVTATKADEPVAKALSVKKAAEFIDGVSLAWTRERKCMTCHTNVPYMLARPLIKGGDQAAISEIRTFLEANIKKWETAKHGSDYNVLASAFALAGHDRQTTGKLSPATKAALDKSWTLQKADGSWSWPDCDWPPLEHDQFYGVAFMAVAIGLAPEDYAKTPQAQAALKKMNEYIAKNPTQELHHKATMLWATKLGVPLLTEDEQKNVIAELRKLQQPDGGWNLPSLGPYTKRKDGSENKLDAPSDGYATGFTVYVLRQAGVPADDPAIKKAVVWLQQHQRDSGRWFTRSPKADKAHYITNAGSSFCVLALDACGIKLSAE